ncbi:MAG TPA: cytochrome c oxidase subunit 3 [Rhodanobacteraceae bacterium]|jgi:cytochrome c oxidase subunit 3|nr:cytochrome c oxidase subunit 3 [Rhodanobacteraceae bacterium]
MNATVADSPLEEARRAHLEEQFDEPDQQHSAASLGMWIFLATEMLFFGVLFASYVVLRVLHPAGFAEASRETDLLLGSGETAALLTSSITIVVALRAIKLGQRGVATLFLSLTAALGIGFLVIHGFEYHSEWEEHLVPGVRFLKFGPHAHAVELFEVMSYLLTGWHSIHLIIAVSVVLGLTWRVWRGAFGPDHFTTLELAALYWHLVDIIWMFIFPLLYLIGRAPG